MGAVVAGDGEEVHEACRATGGRHHPRGRLDESLRLEAREDPPDDDLARECRERGPGEEELVDLRLGQEAKAGEVRDDLGLTSE